MIVQKANEHRGAKYEIPGHSRRGELSLSLSLKVNDDVIRNFYNNVSISVFLFICREGIVLVLRYQSNIIGNLGLSQ